MRPCIRIFAALRVVHIGACTANGTTADRTADSSAAAAAPGVTSSTDPAAVRRTIEAANTRYVDALKRADIGGMAANYADDAVSLPQNQEAVRGHAAISKLLIEDSRAMRVTDARLTTEDVMVGGDLAVDRSVRNGDAADDRRRHQGRCHVPAFTAFSASDHRPVLVDLDLRTAGCDGLGATAR